MKADIYNAMVDALICGQITQETFDKFQIDFSDNKNQQAIAFNMRYAYEKRMLKTYCIAFISLYMWSVVCGYVLVNFVFTRI